MINGMDWGAQAETITRGLLGEPNFIRNGELRYGLKGSLKVNVAPSQYAGSWVDFESGVSGGMPALIERCGGYVSDYLATGELMPSVAPRGITTKIDPGNIDYARQLWEDSVEIPIDNDHPVRRWLAHRRLWRPGLALPGAIRWLPGKIVVLVAHPLFWIQAWPKLPALQAIQTIIINDDGTPGKDSGGLNKRSFGSTKGGVVMLGNPEGSVNRITEGVADALSIAIRYEGATWALLGVNGFKHWESLLYLAMKRCVIHADKDTTGIAAAQGLVQGIAQAGGNAEWVLPSRGKDFAEEALEFPLLPDPSIVQFYADTLYAAHPDWDWGEISRVAVIAAGE